ncbi:hypothetical protein BGZ94_001005 [Podila epigama]|nr:hypothetical protein BGZ94_001005 [Podila epigama]
MKHSRSTRHPTGDDPRPFPSGPRDNANPSWSFPQWFNFLTWYRMQFRRAVFRAFTGGALVTALGFAIYDGTFRQWEHLSGFANNFMFIQESLSPADALRRLRSLGSGDQARALLNDPIGTVHLAPGWDKRLKLMTPGQVELRLLENQRSFKLDTACQVRGTRLRRPQHPQPIVRGYSVNQVASNNPIEDDVSQHITRDVDGQIDGIFFGVFDGHGGWCCSQKVAQELAPSVAKELSRIRDLGQIESVIEAIENGFLKLDRRIVHDTVERVLDQPTKTLACASLLPALCGSCALLAYVDTVHNDLYVACAGDSRAVLGVKEPTEDGGHVWRAVPMSFDQTGRNPWEVKRLQQEHPNEESTVVRRGRVLGGLEPTRAFGDSRYKWTLEIQEKVFALFPAYRQPPKHFKTPPYVTAKPVVRHHKIQTNDRFLVMATDGLWDKLTSDEVVQLVGSLLDGKVGQEDLVLDREAIEKYKQERREARRRSEGPANHQKTTSSQQRQLLEQQEEEEEVTPVELSPKGPASQTRRFTYKDHANVATHLIRNALGGADDEKVAGTLSLPSPMSRRYRDDITVTVILLGPQENKLTLYEAQDAISDAHGFVEIP